MHRSFWEKLGGPAFPQPRGTNRPDMDEGISILDYFAAEAMSAFDFTKLIEDSKNCTKQELADAVESLAIIVYAVAAAMVVERRRLTDEIINKEGPY